MMTLREALTVVAHHRTDEAVIATMSACVHWPSLSDSDRDLGYYAPMGSAGALGLGLALARPDVGVIVLDGDGSLLMNLGVLVTIGAWRPHNLLHIVLNNGKYDVTGGQPIPGVTTARFADLAAAAGIPVVHDVETLDDWRSTLPQLVATDGCRFVNVKVESYYDRAALPGMMNAPEARSRHTRAGYHNLMAALARIDTKEQRTRVSPRSSAIEAQGDPSHAQVPPRERLS